MNNDIRKIIDDNWDDIKELIAQKAEEEQKPKTIWDYNANNRTSYHYIDETGYIRTVRFDEDYFEIRRDLSNAFLTKEEAEFERERREIEAVMRKYSRPFKYDEYNYHIEYYHENNTLIIGVCRHINVGMLCFESEEIAQKVIDEIGQDRLKKYWFGAEE